MAGLGGKRHVWWFALALVVIAASACGNETADTEQLFDDVADAVAQETTTTSTEDIPPQVVPDGYTLFEGKEGFQIALPESWTPFTPDDSGIEELLNLAGEELDIDLFDEQIGTLFANNGVLIAFDFESGDPEFADNINILIGDSQTAAVDLLQKMTVQQFESYGFTDVTAETVAMPAGQAIIFEYSAPMFGSQAVAMALLGELNTWTITVSANDWAEATIDPDLVFDTFRIDP